MVQKIQRAINLRLKKYAELQKATKELHDLSMEETLRKLSKCETLYLFIGGELEEIKGFEEFPQKIDITIPRQIINVELSQSRQLKINAAEILTYNENGVLVSAASGYGIIEQS